MKEALKNILACDISRSYILFSTAFLNNRYTMSTLPSKFIARLNTLRSLQQQVHFWESTSRDYKRACIVFEQYVDCIRGFDDPKSLVNAFIRYAAYCENMDDILLSRSLLKEAVNLMHRFQVGTEIHLEKMKQKIDQLRYFF